jgi:hypothetical protein
MCEGVGYIRAPYRARKGDQVGEWVCVCVYIWGAQVTGYLQASSISEKKGSCAYDGGSSSEALMMGLVFKHARLALSNSTSTENNRPLVKQLLEEVRLAQN